MDGFDKKNNLEAILDDSSNLSLNQIRTLLNKMSPSEIAHALESSPPKQRNLLFSLLKTEEEGDVLFEVGEEIQQDLISSISNEELTEAVKELELDEIVDILQNLPEERMKKILSKMSEVDRNRIEMGLNYADNTAGGLLNTDVISVRPNNSIKRVARFLSIFSNHLEKNKVINNKYRSEEIEEIIKSRFTVTWKLWYDMQIPLLVSWKKFFDDLETWHIWGVCVVNQGFEQSKKAKIKMNRLQYFKSISDPDKNFRGLNAMTLSEISGIPRATVVRKLKNLLKFKYLKKDLKKHYILTDITDDEMHAINKTMLRSLAIFSTKIFNLSLNKS